MYAYANKEDEFKFFFSERLSFSTKCLSRTEKCRRQDGYDTIKLKKRAHYEHNKVTKALHIRNENVSKIKIFQLKYVSFMSAHCINVRMRVNERERERNEK